MLLRSCRHQNKANWSFNIGAIQLTLTVAARSDRANLALSWIMDGRPAIVSTFCYWASLLSFVSFMLMSVASEGSSQGVFLFPKTVL